MHANTNALFGAWLQLSTLRSCLNTRCIETKMYVTFSCIWRLDLLRPALFVKRCDIYQSRTQKIFMGVSFDGIWWSFVFGMRCLWRHKLTSYSTFQTNVLATFVDIICIVFYTHSSYFMCHCTEYKLSALQVRILEGNKLNATTQQFITAKMSGSVLKQGSKTHSSLRQSNLKLQNEAALMSCRIRAVEHRMCAAGLADAHSGLHDRIILNYTRIDNAHEVLRKKTCDFLICIEAQQIFSYLFSCWHISNAWMLLC